MSIETYHALIDQICAEFSIPDPGAMYQAAHLHVYDADFTLYHGGVILPELHLGRDAPLGVALLLQQLLEDPRPVSRVVADAPRYAIIKDKLARPGAPLDTVYSALRSAFPEAEADTQDGLRLGWPDRWVHVRPSGTEPVVRVIAEAPTRAEAQKLVERGRELLARLS